VHLNLFKIPTFLLILGIRFPKAMDLSAQTLTITSKVGFLTIFLSTSVLASVKICIVIVYSD